MITGINESKTLTKHYYVKVNVDLMEKKHNSDHWWNNNVNVSVKNVMYVKKITFGILLHVFAKMENI